MSTTQQPEALRLAVSSSAMADEGEMIHLLSWHEIRNLLRADATELRRLHAECETLRTGYAAARLEIESLRARGGVPRPLTAEERAVLDVAVLDSLEVVHGGKVAPAGEYPALPGRTTDELTESQREAAIAAYRAAHGHDPDFGFAPDRSWIEGAAYVDADRAMRAAQPAGAQQPGADPELLKFYGVTTDAELIAAQAAHIKKLQAKLPKTPSFAPQRVREG